MIKASKQKEYESLALDVMRRVVPTPGMVLHIPTHQGMICVPMEDIYKVILKHVVKSLKLSTPL